MIAVFSDSTIAIVLQWYCNVVATLVLLRCNPNRHCLRLNLSFLIFLWTQLICGKGFLTLLPVSSSNKIIFPVWTFWVWLICQNTVAPSQCFEVPMLYFAMQFSTCPLSQKTPAVASATAMSHSWWAKSINTNLQTQTQWSQWSMISDCADSCNLQLRLQNGISMAIAVNYRSITMFMTMTSTSWLQWYASMTAEKMQSQALKQTWQTTYSLAFDDQRKTKNCLH